jgi:hypothetical protein
MESIIKYRIPFSCPDNRQDRSYILASIPQLLFSFFVRYIKLIQPSPSRFALDGVALKVHFRSIHDQKTF